MSLICEMEIAGFPKTINAMGRKHWALKAKEATRWKNLVHDMCVFHRIAGLNLKKAKLTLTRFSSRECDFDGTVSSFKHVIDGLVQAKVVENDKTSNIGQPTYLWEAAKPGKGKIRIKIETVDTE